MIATLILSTSQRANTLNVYKVTYPTCQLIDSENEMKKKKWKFSHWHKMELHDCFLNLHHMIKTIVAMTAIELQKYCPFLSLIHSEKSTAKIKQSHTYDALIMRTGPDRSNIFPTNSKREKRTPSHFLFICDSISRENMTICCQHRS